MNRKSFGKIVASSRQDLGLTQMQLAERAEIALPIVSQIERGVKRYFDPETLVALADSLELTTFERRQFFLASTGVDLQSMVRPNLLHNTSDTADPQKELAKIKQAADQLLVPAFVIDPYGDFIMVNRSMMALFDVDDSQVAVLSQTPHAFNSIHLTFGKGMLTRAQMDWNWEQYAFNTMRSFRELSLRYRAQPYFQYLFKIFSDPDEYPYFGRFWKNTASVEGDKEANWDFLEYKDKNHGHVKYMAVSVIFITVFGELHLIQYQPLNENTARIFTGLAETYGTEMFRFASWPEKKFPV